MHRIKGWLLVYRNGIIEQDLKACLFVLILAAVMAASTYFPWIRAGHPAVEGAYTSMAAAGSTPIPVQPDRAIREVGFRLTPVPAEPIPIRKITWHHLSFLETLALAQPLYLPVARKPLDEPLPVPFGCEASTAANFERELFALVNAERERRGLGLLTWNDDLARAARKHSLDMACNDYFSHTTLEDIYFDQRVSDEGYAYDAVGETLYAGDGIFNTPVQAFNGWYNSADHFNVMTHPALTEVGIGYVYSPGSRYGGYFTADFATPE